MKKALIFDPYLDTLGGGERYTLTFALALIKKGYTVEIAWKSDSELKKATDRFGLDFSQIVVNESAYKLCTRKTSILERQQFTSAYDLIFWVSDGSVPLLFSKNNLVHFQVPFTKLGGSRLINQLKASFVNKFVYNSNFTKSVLEKSLPKSKSFVLYPPVDISKFHEVKKQNLILSVARFGSPLHGKRQDVLIEAFKKFSQKVAGFHLVLAGGTMPGDDSIKKLRNTSRKMDVSFVPNPSFDTLKNLYAKSKFFWHAAGFKVDEQKNPERVEHFGMTTVEAMSAGCVPVAIKRGGQKEIITPECGSLVETSDDFANATVSYVHNKKLLANASATAKIRSKEYSVEKFYEKISSLLIR